MTDIEICGLHELQLARATHCLNRLCLKNNSKKKTKLRSLENWKGCGASSGKRLPSMPAQEAEFDGELTGKARLGGRDCDPSRKWVETGGLWGLLPVQSRPPAVGSAVHVLGGFSHLS